MIYYNSNTINDWNFGDDNIIKVYRNNAVCYYKITGGGDTPTAQTPCFAVVDDISQYSDTEFEDVFNNADNKWYKLNNLNQYEQYGLYGSGRTITTYDGKLTIDDGYEYMYSGGSWVNVGEVSGSTQIIKSPVYLEKDSSHNGKINLDYVWKTNSKMQFKFYSTNNGGGAMIGEDGVPDNNDCRMFFASTTAYFDWGSRRISWSSNGRKNTLYEYEYGNYYIKNMVTSASKTGLTISTSRTNSLYFGLGGTDYFRTYYLKFYEGDTLVKDFIPWTDTNGNYGLYEKVSNTIYSATSGSFTASSVWNDVEVGGGYIYPLEYVVKEDPPNNLTFSSMTEAEEYECPWVGMKATIDGDKYVFSGDSQSGYEWVYNPSRLPAGYTEVEYLQSTNRISNTQSTTRFNVQGDNTSGNTYTLVYELPSDAYSVSYYAWLFGNDAVCYQKLDNGWGTQMVSPKYFGRDGRQSASGAVGTKVELVMSKDNFKITDVQAGTTQTVNYPSTRSYTNSNRFGIFCLYNKNDTYCAVGKIYEFKIEDVNGTVLNDYIPAVRDSDNKPGVYDIVGDAFYFDESGTLTIVAGDPV